jgi:hypothetical protein
VYDYHRARLAIREFKDPGSLTAEDRAADAAFNAHQYERAQEARLAAGAGDALALARATADATRGGVYQAKFADEVPDDLRDLLFTQLAPGELSEAREVRTRAPGEAAPLLLGYEVVKLLDRHVMHREAFTFETATVSHLLVSYEGAVGAQDAITRTKEEAKALATRYLNEATKEHRDFSELIQASSDDPSKADNKGRFVDQVIGDANPANNAFVKEFNDAVVAAKPGMIVGPVETAFGYHLIRVEQKTPRADSATDEPAVSYAEIFFPARLSSGWRDTGLTDAQLERAIARPLSDGTYEVVLTFNKEGARLFDEITNRNIGKQVAIFLDGAIISEPTVQSEITAGEAVITGNFTADQAAAIARELTQARATLGGSAAPG